MLLNLAVGLFLVSSVIFILNGPPDERDNPRSQRVDTSAYGIACGLALAGVIAVISHGLSSDAAHQAAKNLKLQVSANAKP